jgi:hypothetical protein
LKDSKPLGIATFPFHIFRTSHEVRMRSKPQRSSLVIKIVVFPALPTISKTTLPRFPPLHFPSGVKQGVQNEINVKMDTGGCGSEARIGERLLASLPRTALEPEKRHLPATFPADHAHPVHLQNLAPGRAPAAETLPGSELLSCCCFLFCLDPVAQLAPATTILWFPG